MKFLIVGQGLAGTLISFNLWKKGVMAIVVDPHNQGAASLVAAGLINPVTGKRIVKSWLIDQLLPVATQTYRELEEFLGIPIHHPKSLLRVLKNAGEENSWLARSAEPDYQAYFQEPPPLDTLSGKIKPQYGWGETRLASQNALGDLVKSYRNFLIEKGLLWEESLDYAGLRVSSSGIEYRDHLFDGVIFCEGAAAIKNPFFNYLPFNLAKGEALVIRIPEISLNQILKHGIALVPLREDLYWVGSTNSWDFSDDLPSHQARQELLDGLEKMIQTPYEVIEHKAAIRPTVRDRRPFLGTHPEFGALHIFNGLGTKGASLGPYFARQMADYLLKKKPFNAEVNIRRFQEKF